MLNKNLGSSIGHEQVSNDISPEMPRPATELNRATFYQHRKSRPLYEERSILINKPVKNLSSMQKRI